MSNSFYRVITASGLEYFAIASSFAEAEAKVTTYLSQREDDPKQLFDEDGSLIYNQERLDDETKIVEITFLTDWYVQ